MPVTKFCPNYADLRNYKIPKIKRSEQSGEVVLNRTEEQNNRSPVKAASAQQSRKPQAGTPEKATTAGRPQKLRSSPSSLGGKSSSKGLMDQIIDEMDKSYPKVTGTHLKSTFPSSSRRESGAADPACQRSPAKRPLVQDSSFGNANGTAPAPPPEKKSAFGAPFPRSWEEPRQLCIVCRRRSVSDSGLRDTCIRCSFTQGYRDKQGREDGVVRDKPAAAVAQLPPRRPTPEPSPAKPSSRRGSSDVENRRERIVRSRQDGGVSRLDSSGTETTGSSSPVKRHGCDRKKRAIRKACRSKVVISSSDESSDAETDSRGAAPGSLEENRIVSAAASSPRKGSLDGRVKPAREPHLLREKNDNSDGASALVRTASEDKKAGSSSTVLKKKKQKGTDEGIMKRQKQKNAWKKAKDTAEYLKAVGEFPACDQPLELENTSHEQAKADAKDGAKDEEVESVEAVLACLRQSEREKLAKTANSEEAEASIPVPKSDEVASGTSDLKQPLNPGLIVSSCRSLSMDDWEKLEAETDKHEDSAASHAEASIDVRTPAPHVISLSSDSSSSDEVVDRTERLNCSFVRANLSSSIELGDSSSDTSEETNAAVRLTGFSYEVSYNEDGVPCVRVRDTSSSDEKQLSSSSSDDDIAEVTERDCGESLADARSMAPDEAHSFDASVSHRHPVSLTGEGSTEEGLCGQPAVTPPASVCSMAEEGFREESSITSPVTASASEEGANTETLRAGTANNALHGDSVVAFSCSSPPAADVHPGKETPVPASFPWPNQEPLPVGDQTWSLPSNASELGLAFEEEAGGSASLGCEDRSLVVQQLGLPATTADTSSSNNDSSAEWDLLRAVDELLAHHTDDAGSPKSRCRLEQLEGIVREYISLIERFLATFGSSTPEVQAALFDGFIAEGGFAKLGRIMLLLWHSEATRNCVSRERVMALQDAMCSVFAEYIARLGPASTEPDLPPDLLFEPLPPEALQQQSVSPLGTEMGPSLDQVGEVDTGPCNSVDTSEARPDSVVAPETTGRPEPGRTPAAMIVTVPVAEDGATACQTPQSSVENGLSDTRPSGVVGGVSADPTEARRTPVTETAVPAASPRVPEPAGTAATAQVVIPRKPPPPYVQASTWHPPVVRLAVQANGSGSGLVQVPEADHSLEAAPETRSVGMNGDVPSKVLPSPAGSSGSACVKVLLQPRSTNLSPGARVPTQNPPPPPPPLQKGRAADGTPQGVNGTLARIEFRDPPPLQRAPNLSTMSQEQFQELQCQLAYYSYVTNRLNGSTNAGGQPPNLAARPPQSSPQQSQPLNPPQPQVENATALKRMPPLQYMPLRAQSSAAAGARPSNNQPLPQKPQSSRESPPGMPILIRPPSANQPLAGAGECSQGPPANRELPGGEATALAQAQAHLQRQLHRRRYYELFLRYRLALSPEERQRMQRTLKNVLAARAGGPTGRSAPASEARPEIMYSSFQQQLQQGGSVEQSSSGPSLTGVTVPNGGAPNGSVGTPKGHAVAVAHAENGSSQRGTQLVRPWCDQPQRQPPTQQPQWPYPYAACQEAVVRYKQQQQNSAEAVSGAAGESNHRDYHYTSSMVRPSSTWGSSSGQQSQAPNQPTVVRSPPEQGQAASTSDGLQGRNGALHAVLPNQHTAYQRLVQGRQGSGSLFFSHAGVHVVSTPSVSRPPSEARAAPRATPEAPRRAGKAPPPDTRSLR